MKEKYENLKNSKLPKYDYMVNEYGIDTIGKDDNIVREIIKKIAEKIDFFARQLESLIQPDSSVSSMKEAGSLSPTEMLLVTKKYNHSMFLLRELLELNLEYSEKKALDKIIHLDGEWKKMKPDMLTIVKKMKESWANNEIAKIERGYFG